MRTGFKLTTLGVYGLILIGLSSAGADFKEHARIAEEARVAREAEEARLIAAANEEVAALVDEARVMLEAADIEGATTKLNAALGVSKANNRRLASGLLQAVQDSGDAEHVFGMLVSLPEDQFAAFREDDAVPAALTFDFEALTKQAVALAKPELDRAAEVRAERDRQRIAAEEARRQREAEETGARPACRRGATTARSGGTRTGASCG